LTRAVHSTGEDGPVLHRGDDVLELFVNAAS